MAAPSSHLASASARSVSISVPVPRSVGGFRFERPGGGSDRLLLLGGIWSGRRRSARSLSVRNVASERETKDAASPDEGMPSLLSVTSGLLPDRFGFLICF